MRGSAAAPRHSGDTPQTEQGEVIVEPRRIGRVDMGISQRARRLEFGAKLCIHPQQIDTVQAVLCPNDAERAWAALVI